MNFVYLQVWTLWHQPAYCELRLEAFSCQAWRGPQFILLQFRLSNQSLCQGKRSGMDWRINWCAKSMRASIDQLTKSQMCKTLTLVSLPVTWPCQSANEQNWRLNLEQTPWKIWKYTKVLWPKCLDFYLTGFGTTAFNQNCIWSDVCYLNTRQLNRLSALWNGWRQACTRLASLGALIKNPCRHSKQPGPVPLWIGPAMLTLRAKENREKSPLWSHGLCQEGSAIIPMDRFTATLKSNATAAHVLMDGERGQRSAFSLVFFSKNTPVTNNTMIAGQIAQNRPFSRSLITHGVTLAANKMPCLPTTTNRVWPRNNQGAFPPTCNRI